MTNGTELVDPTAPHFDTAPPGERYFRHPGDVVRLVLWGIAALVLAFLIAVGTHTSDGVTDDIGRAVSRAPESTRPLYTAPTPLAPLALPITIARTLLYQQQ